MPTVHEPERATHTHQHTEAIADQLARTAGHVWSIKRLVEDHLDSCVAGAAAHGMAADQWERLKNALDSFVR